MLAKYRNGWVNPSWKGDKASYSGIHKRINHLFGPAKDYPCMFCNGTRGSKRIDWANLDGKYTMDFQTWTTLCRICHELYDKRRGAK